MICINCRNKVHQDCPGGNWCDCQHKSSGVNKDLIKISEGQV